MNEIEKCIREENYTESLSACLRTNHNYLGQLLSYVIKSPSSQDIVDQFTKNIEGLKKEGIIVSAVEDEVQNENPALLSDEDNDKEMMLVVPKTGKTRVKVVCNWCTPEQLREDWNKMSKGNYSWNDIELVLDNPDYYVVINCPPPGVTVNPSKTIIFRMEPYMGGKYKYLWGEWANPDPNKFFRVCYHRNDYNNICWHISSTYDELKKMTVVKDEKLDNSVSTVLSPKYYDPGHIKRVDFVKFLEKKGLPVHVFGSNKWDYKDYKGSLPIYEKNNAMFPYKYVFNCENHSIKNYYTEKLIDGILAECLVFYSGCHNVKEYIDERAFVWLELSNFEADYQKVKKAMEENLWEKRIVYIRKAKKKILDYLNFFPRLERIINKTEDIPYKEKQD